MLNQIRFIHALLISSVLGIPTTPNPDSLLHILEKRSVTCFTPALTRGTLQPVRASDCRDVITQIIRGGRAEAPMDFSTTTGFVLPYHWTYRSCIVAASIDDDEIDTFPLTYIAAAAASILQICNNRDFGLGGLTLAGPKSVVKVRVVGIMVTREPSPMEICNLIVGAGSRAIPRDETSGIALNCTT